MLSKTLSMILISIPFALTVPAANAADTAGATELTAQTSTTQFLQPLCGRLSDGTRCPTIIFNGQVAGGGISNIAPAFTADRPNVWVGFFMQQIHNEVVANGGVDEGPSVNLTTTGTDGVPQTLTLSLPGPGQTFNFAGFGGIKIYDALVVNPEAGELGNETACSSFSSFPVTHESTLSGGGLPGDGHGIVADPFKRIDDSTIDSTGFYNLNYTIRAARDGGVSDFHFSGNVFVTCTELNELP